MYGIISDQEVVQETETWRIYYQELNTSVTCGRSRCRLKVLFLRMMTRGRVWMT